MIFVYIRKAVEKAGVVPSRLLLQWYQYTSRVFMYTCIYVSSASVYVCLRLDHSCLRLESS